jgi:hypothetical protein
MEDVLVEQCGDSGVFAYGPGVVGRCTNVEVRQCGENGVFARFGASITLIGAKTTVHHNCTKGRSHCYGLTVEGSPSTIQLVSPLTKEEVSVDNGGFCKFIKATGGVASGNWGGKWGADLHQTKTIGVDPPTNNCCVCC